MLAFDSESVNFLVLNKAGIDQVILGICYHGFQERHFYFLAKAGDDVIIWCGLHSNYQHMNTALIKEEIKHITEISNSLLHVPD